MDKIWQNVQSSLQKELGRDIFNNWISALDYNKFEDGKIIFRVPSSFIANWIESNYSDKIIALFKKEGLDVLSLIFDCENQKGEMVKSEVSIKSNTTSGNLVFKHNDSIELPSSPLDKRFTFDRFVVGKPNELAHAAAKRVADGGSVTFNPLFLYGGVGLGKTHLMHAIAWQTKIEIQMQECYIYQQNNSCIVLCKP